MSKENMTANPGDTARYLTDGDIEQIIEKVLLAAKERGGPSKKKEYLTETEVQDIYNMKVATLRNWRSLKQGPRYIKLGTKKVLYRVSDVEGFLAACQVPTTSFGE